MSVELFEVRPRFRKLVPHSMEELTGNVKTSLEASAQEITGSVGPSYLVLKVKSDERHFWTPQLNVSLEDDPNGTIVNGMYGPRPDIWMLFVFLYFLCGFITLVVLIIGLSQYQLGLSAYILWAIPFTLGGIFVLWFSSRTGQRLGKDQLQKIHGFVQQHLLVNGTDV
ncbi:MAG: hypothetical protein H6562_00595 [Lewinellaceae bacterium]|nr:hypothetical protein [Lewinella sp.]MCB9277384.1 hypothetical protein [Lewinellaceae bacterium]